MLRRQNIRSIVNQNQARPSPVLFGIERFMQVPVVSSNGWSNLVNHGVKGAGNERTKQ